LIAIQSRLEPLCVGPVSTLSEWRDDPTPPDWVHIHRRGVWRRISRSLSIMFEARTISASARLYSTSARVRILSIASALLASAVVACDVDPVAIDIASAAFDQADVRACCSPIRGRDSYEQR
jgi:hypothetical protein